MLLGRHYSDRSVGPPYCVKCCIFTCLLREKKEGNFQLYIIGVKRHVPCLYWTFAGDMMNGGGHSQPAGPIKLVTAYG